MKIAIADDEILVRVGIRSLLHWSDYDSEVIWEASNGNETLAKIEARTPDLLFLDITMPGMDGLEVIKAVQGRFKELSIIVISCHEEFLIVRQALLSGAEDYLLKHALTKENLIHIMEEKKYKKELQIVQNNSAAEKESHKEKSGEERLHVIRDFLEEKSDRKMEELFGSAEEVTALMVRIRDFDRILIRYEQKENGFLQTVVTDIVEKILFCFSSKLILPLRADPSDCFLILVGRNQPPDDFQQLDLGQKLLSGMKKYLNLSVEISISQSNRGKEKFLTALRQVRQVQEQSFFRPEADILLWKYCDSEQHRKKASAHIDCMATRLKAAVKLRKEKEFLCGLEQGLDELKKNPEAGAFYIKGILLLVVRDIFALSLVQTEQMAEEIHRASRIDDIRELFIRGYHFNQSNMLSVYQSDNYLVRQAMEYLKEHYREPVTLKELSEFLHVSSGYISRLFKTEADTNIFKYLNLVRIEQAKILLKDHTLKPYQVAELAGFNNRVYFDNVFKNLVGMTPSEYRKHN